MPNGTDEWQTEITYDSDLPPIVRDWHIYLTDSAHCLLTLVEGMFEYTAPGEQWKHLVAVPVERVLSGYRIYAGYSVTDKNLHC
jgi:uncharacterized protein YjeT (DUF2065 family)